MIDRLLAPLRAAVRDLVDKRLWPIALALVVALVAVPVVIGGSGEAPPPVAAVTPAAPAEGAAARSAITVAEPAVVGHSRPGAVNDPFYDPPQPKLAAGGSSDAAPAAAPARPDAPAGAASATTATTAKATTAKATAPAAKQAPAAGDTIAERAVYRTHVTWGREDGADARGLSRLQPLGGLADPALVYLGTTAHGARAVFVLGPRADSDGEGVCAERSCRVIALKPGDRRVVEVLDDAGDRRMFTLVVDDVTRRVMDTKLAAQRSRARVHPYGLDVLAEISRDAATATALAKLAVDRATGAVVARSAS